ncbi:MAG: hypothetical protein ACD_2C00095G0002 [uncultured bacterium (gcode 4)]|uniref:Uncharacterized protein n=1 Tax=uncultured bacterium (gcode 4) TaxID=1234023 RepID=K2H1S7_9BACT|nr:MAG: hypothetical protein ACD_2C00095G0002 [uncultured bacterium (gcode 4)]
MWLHILTHIYPDKSVLIAEKLHREGFCSFSLSYSCGSKEQEASDRPFFIGQSSLIPLDCLSNELKRLILSDDPLVHPFKKMQISLFLMLDKLSYRNSGPFWDDFGDIFEVNPILEVWIPSFLVFVEFILYAFNLLFNSRDFRIPYPCYCLVIEFPLKIVCFHFQFLYLVLIFLDFLYKVLLILPFAKLSPEKLLLIRKLFFYFIKAECIRIALVFQCFFLDFKRPYLFFERIQLNRLWGRGHLHTRWCFVYEVYGLIWQLPVWDVFEAELNGTDYRPVRNLYSMERFIFIFYSS